MFYFSEALVVSCLLCFFTPLLCHRADGDPCESLLNTPFEICKEAGYETMVPYPIDVPEESKEGFALDMKKTIEIMKSTNCAASGLVEAIECSLFAPKCNSLGDPIFPCRRVCAEYLKQCKKELHSFDLHELIPHCLLLPNETSSCTQCFFPPNFTTSSDPEPGESTSQEKLMMCTKKVQNDKITKSISFWDTLLRTSIFARYLLVLTLAKEKCMVSQPLKLLILKNKLAIESPHAFENSWAFSCLQFRHVQLIFLSV